jgi:hypothetical protein
VTAAGVSRAAPAAAAAAVVHFQADGGISGSYLAGQLAGNGQSIGALAFITSAAGGNLELLARGGAGTRHPIISVAPEAGGGATLDLENNDLVGVETVVPSPGAGGQLTLDGRLAFTPQAAPAVPASGGVLRVSGRAGPSACGRWRRRWWR